MLKTHFGNVFEGVVQFTNHETLVEYIYIYIYLREEFVPSHPGCEWMRDINSTTTMMTLADADEFNSTSTKLSPGDRIICFSKVSSPAPPPPPGKGGVRVSHVGIVRCVKRLSCVLARTSAQEELGEDIAAAAAARIPWGGQPDWRKITDSYFSH